VKTITVEYYNRQVVWNKCCEREKICPRNRYIS